jgi:hypothetical protein
VRAGHCARIQFIPGHVQTDPVSSYLSQITVSFLPRAPQALLRSMHADVLHGNPLVVRHISQRTGSPARAVLATTQRDRPLRPRIRLLLPRTTRWPSLSAHAPAVPEICRKYCTVRSPAEKYSYFTIFRRTIV